MFTRVASALLSRLREGRLELADAGGAAAFGPAGAALRATVACTTSFLRALPRGSLALAESYGRGAWDCDDLVALVRIGARELPRLDRLRRPFVPLRNLLTRVPRNTRAGARRHIAAHYDLGNEMFRLFLDETMTYSCAYFESPEATLREAQEAKLDRVCRKLELGPDDHVVEIGTGWGSFALHAAGRYGCRVTTTTISREQHAVARSGCASSGPRGPRDGAARGLPRPARALRQARVDRDDRGGRLAVLRHVLPPLRRAATPDGLMLLQAITIADRAYELEKASRSFIRELIFPAGCLPSVEVIRAAWRA